MFNVLISEVIENGVSVQKTASSGNLTSIKRLNCRPSVPSRPVPSVCVCTVNMEPYIMYVLRYRPYVGIVS